MKPEQDETGAWWGALSCLLQAAPHPRVSSQSLSTLQPSKGLSSCFFNIIVLVCECYHQTYMDIISTENHCLEKNVKADPQIYFSPPMSLQAKLVNFQ